jgi:UPF0271 protein
MSTTTGTRTIDLNADLGESYGRWKLGDDDAILKIVSSANVACGMHAGDPHVMAHTFECAKKHGVKVGAHPGYPDIWGFGRREMVFSTTEIEQFIAYQIGAAMGVATYVGHPISYVKPHGAVAHLSRIDKDVAGAVVRGIAAVDPTLVLLTFPDGHAIRIARDMGLPTCAEIFADRAYEPDGRLVSRSKSGAVLSDPAAVAERAVRMIRAGAIEAIDGSLVPMDIGSICVHGDSPGALAMSAEVRKRLTEDGIEIKSFV